jgi:hypothetical protein
MNTTEMSNTNQGLRAAGQTSRTAAVDPRNPLLVQPYKRLVDEGFVTSLTIKFTPMGVSSMCQVDSRVVSAGSGLALGTDYPVAMIARLADEGNLIPKRGSKRGAKGPKAAQLPKKSLCKEDFSDSATLKKRAEEVTAACGSGGLVGRIGSAGLLPEKTVLFDQWWAVAAPVDRLVLLTTKDHREVITKNVGQAKAGPMLRALGCPFQDSLEVRVAAATPAKEEAAAPKTPPPSAETKGSAHYGRSV